MTKRKRPERPNMDGDISPPPERHQHGLIERLPQSILDDQGRIAQPLRARDTLELMERAGTITTAMLDAGAKFHAQFFAAGFVAIKAADISRIPGNSGPAGSRLVGSIDAKRRINDALAACGGHASPGGSCLWHVVGCENTLKEWALRGGWNGKPVHQHRAAGILISALCILTAFYESAKSN